MKRAKLRTISRRTVGDPWGKRLSRWLAKHNLGVSPQVRFPQSGAFDQQAFVVELAAVVLAAAVGVLLALVVDIVLNDAVGLVVGVEGAELVLLELLLAEHLAASAPAG
eukprot:CAMPEP_0171504966 /NCGR_PEP_ID=MMETSP0958-20121227/11917_1 /TAXON_ID=87120 /ORGANISM="Aurantiochytrium limacinum, Strain ATCCMYA-1381" /LENGTH=108 /DNA_ID=CAMNT_0012040971 /DNA_START=360 /DNA_END=687 /DNA_ORIENTATION=-